MTFLFKGYQVDYDFINNSKPSTLVLLHGWGGNKSSFLNLDKYFQSKFNVLKISFPPYFTSNNENLKSVLPLTIYDYKDLVLLILKIHNIRDIYIVCHSFGFRVSLLLSSQINIKKIVVTAGAGIKLKPTIFKTLTLNSKILFSKRKIYNPNNDYTVLDNVDKQTFKNIVNENLINYTHIIKCPTLLFWGKKDKDTSIKICNFLKKNIKDVSTQIFNDDHFTYLHHNQQFVHSCIDFFKE